MKRFQFLYSVPLLVLLSALSLVGCRDSIFDRSLPDLDDSEQTEVTTDGFFEATVSFSSTDLKVPTLKALDKAGENEIQTDKVKAYVFQSFARSTAFLYEAKVTKVEPDATKHKAEGKITLMIKDSGDQLVKVFFVVNATPSTAPAVGTTLEEFQKLFVFNQKDLWGAGELPMYAESKAVKINHSSGAVPSLQETPIPFLRAVARVDVMLGVKSGDKFDETTTGLKTKGGQDLKITSIKAFNVADKGYAIPLQANVENSTTAPKVKATSLPEGLTKKSTPTSYLANSTGVDALMRTIYIPELNNKPHDATAQADGQNKPEKDQTNYLARPYLILGIKGAVEGDASKVTYFRVDYLKRTGEEATATYEYLDILRNYRYMVNITNIGGPGFDNEEDAKKGPAANIMYNVVVWDESTLSNVVYDGQYMLGVQNDKLLFYKNGGTFSTKVQTSWPKGFEVKGLPKWVKVKSIEPSDPGATGATDEKVVTFEVTEPTTTKRDFSGAYIQAGRMRWNLGITQLNTLDLRIEIFSDPECTQELQYIELDERGKDTPTNDYTVGKMKFYVRVTPAARISAVNDETKAPFTFTGAPATSPSRPPIESANEVSTGVYEFEVTADPLSNPKNPFETRQNKYHFITEQSGEEAEATLSINQTEYNIVFYEDEALTNPMLGEGTAATYYMNGKDKQFYVRSNIPYIIWMDNQMIDESVRSSENANADGSSKFPIVTGYYDKTDKFVQLVYDTGISTANWRNVKTEEAPTPYGSPLKFRAAEAENALKIIYGHVMWVACTTMKSVEWKFPLYDEELGNHDIVKKIQTNFIAGYHLPEANCYPITLGETGLLIPIERRINHAARFYEENFDTPFGWTAADYQSAVDKTAKINPDENWEIYKQRNQLNRLDDDDDISLEVLWTDIQSVTEKVSDLERNPIKKDGTAPLKLLVPVTIKGERYAYLLPGNDGDKNYGNLVFCVRDKDKKRVDNKRSVPLDREEQGKDVILWSFHLILYRPGEIPLDDGYKPAVDRKTITYLDKTKAKDPDNYATDWSYDVKVWPYALGAFDIPQEWLGTAIKNYRNLRDINYRRVGMYYQFGRKDPFPRYNDAKGSPRRFVGHKGKEVYFKLRKSTTISMRESIEYPMVLVGNSGGHQWLTEGGKTAPTNISLGGTSSFGAYGLWGGGSPVGNESSCGQRMDIMRVLTKTVFDPCPYGFRIPIPGYSSTRMFQQNTENADRMRMNYAVFMMNPTATRFYNTYNGTMETLFGVQVAGSPSGTGQVPFAVATSYIAQAHYPVFMFTFGTGAPEERYQADIHRSSLVVVRPFNNVQEADWQKYIRR